jgi:hypothetical protein
VRGGSHGLSVLGLRRTDPLAVRLLQTVSYGLAGQQATHLRAGLRSPGLSGQHLLCALSLAGQEADLSIPLAHLSLREPYPSGVSLLVLPRLPLHGGRGEPSQTRDERKGMRDETGKGRAVLFPSHPSSLIPSLVAVDGKINRRRRRNLS